jgi:putative membrane protein
MLFWTGAACAAVLAPWAVRAQSRPSRTFAPDAAKSASPSSPQEREERKLLRSAATASLLASRAARLALAKSSSPEVRAFATGLAKHHEAAQVDLLRLLQARGMAMPMLDNKQGEFLRRLEKLSGSAFDRELMQGAGPDALRRELRALETAGQTAKDPALRAWVERSLPGLRQQLAVAERTERTGAGATRTAAVPRARLDQNADLTRVDTRVSGSNSR